MTPYSEIKTIHIIGGGIIGASVAYLLSKKYCDNNIIMYEINEIGGDQTNRNSNLLHTGMLSKTGSQKEDFCKSSYILIPELSKKLGARHGRIRKYIKANDEKRYNQLKKKKAMNILENLECDDKNLTISFDTFLIDYKDLAVKMILDCIPFVNLIKIDAAEVAKYDKSDIVFVCTGSKSLDTFKKLTGKMSWLYNVYIDGKYLHYDISSDNATYITQSNTLPFLGVHTTPTFDNKMKLGPDSRFSLLNITKLKSCEEFMARFRFVKKYWWFGLQQSLNYFNIFFKRKYEVDFGKHYKISHSMRTTLIDRHGEMEDSFAIVREENVVSALNTGSPGASCCLKIAECMIEEAGL